MSGISFQRRTLLHYQSQEAFVLFSGGDKVIISVELYSEVKTFFSADFGVGNSKWEHFVSACRLRINVLLIIYTKCVTKAIFKSITYNRPWKKDKLELDYLLIESQSHLGSFDIGTSMVWISAIESAIIKERLSSESSSVVKGLAWLNKIKEKIHLKRVSFALKNFF